MYGRKEEETEVEGNYVRKIVKPLENRVKQLRKDMHEMKKGIESEIKEIKDSVDQILTILLKK